MKTSCYWTLNIHNLPSSEEDGASDWLFSNGASGVHQNLSFSQTDKRYLPVLSNPLAIQLVAYFEEEPILGIGASFENQFPGCQALLTTAPLEDWQNEWKKNWKAFCLADKFWVVPSWLSDDFDVPGAREIFIDPGMAFGTGTHATTQLASELILKADTLRRFSNSVDVGTGSGILAILMDQLGWPSISAYDNDEHAQRVFDENVQRNKAFDLRWDPDWSKAKVYDFIVANIIDGVLLDLKPDFQNSLAVGGHIIFTGILKERHENFLAEMMPGWELETLETAYKDEWVGIHMRRVQ